MRSSNKATLAKLCKRHYYVLHIANHIHCYLSSLLKKNSDRKAKQSIAFGLLLLAGILTTPVSAQTVNICDRTPEVESAILAAITGAPDCTAVTATQLATIDRLNLSSMSIGSLQSDDFAGLANLTELDLGGNLLTALPPNVFSALTNLGTLRLQGNTFATSLPANIFADLPSDAIIQIDLSPIGDLADVVLAVGDTAPIDLSSAFIFRDSFGIDISPTYNATSNNPAIVTVTNTGSMVTITAVDVGTTAVMIAASIPFSAPVIRTISVTAERSTRMSICDRTTEVRSTILAVIPETDDCNLVTVDQLAAITELNLPGMNIRSLLSGDFAGLSGLIALDLSGNSLVALDADIFSDLTSLEVLDLSINSLGTLDADIFSDLTSLIGVDLSNNSLSILPADIFDPLTNLLILFLERNNLGTLDANLFSALTSLFILDLSSNNLSALPAGLFSGLADLDVLFLRNNTFTTPLPIDIFDDLPGGATIEIDLAPFGDLAVALDASGMDTIDLADAFISRDFNGNNRALSLTVTAMNTAIATVTATNIGAMVTITAVAVGTTEVSVTANDGIDDVTRTISVTVETAMSICDRTPEVRNAILAAIPSTSDCNLVTATQLATITELNLISMGIRSLQSDDFAGLANLTSLNLNNNNLSALPAGVFGSLTSLIFLNLSNNSLSTLNADVFDNLTSLNILFLERNSISALPADIFDNLTNLEELYLNRNSLSTLPASVSDLTNLARLGLSGNDLSGVLDADTFSTLTNLEELDLSRTSLSTLPANIFDSLTSLIRLYLDDNSISTLPAGVFDSLTNLSLLSLYRNNLGTLDANIFSALTNLSILDLGINNLSALPAGLFSGLADLDTLNLRNNTFTTPLPIDIFDDLLSTAVQIGLSPFGDLAVALVAGGMDTIDLSNAFISRDLDGNNRALSYSAIMSGDTAVATVTNTGSMVTITAVAVGTTAVSVTANDGIDDVTRTISVTVETAMSICDRTPEVQSAILAAIPSTSDCNLVTATQLAAITELNLFSMGIASLLTGDFAGLTSLTSLTLNNNTLTTLPSGIFGSLTNLIFLNLSNNSLSALNADALSALTNLEKLYLFNNTLTTLPSGIFGSLTSLAELDLSNNALNTLPVGVFGSLANLTTLNLSNNSLSALNADALSALGSLEELYLFNNTLTTLPSGIFGSLTSLTELGLSDNSLSALPAGVFGSLTNLTILNLSNNSLSTLNAGAFSGLTNLERLYLFNNALTTLPAGVFDNLTSLNRLFLESNSLSALPAGVFGSLTNLTILNLSDNSLSTLNADAFSDLTNLERLYLFNNDLTTLPAGVFGSLTSLIFLNLSGNSLSTLNADVFSGLANLNGLFLGDNTFTTPLPIDIFDDLPSGTIIEIDLAPFGDLAGVALVAGGMDTIDLSDAFISRDIDGDARTLSYSAIMSGDTAVATVTNTGSMVTITAVAVGTTAVSVTANDGIDDVTRTISVTVETAMSICDRTAEVRDAILDAITATSDCNLVTATQLAAITELNLFSMGIASLLTGDFAGLDSLTSLILQDNSLSTLPANIFDNLTNLTTLDLSFNNLDALPAGVFDNLTNLTALVLWDNDLDALPADIFDNLTNLTYLDLTSNALTTLPDNPFASLMNLTTLGLSFNSFTTPLPADLFDPLPDDAVIQIDLSPIGDLADISSLTVLGTTAITVSDAFISRDIGGNDQALSFTATPMNAAIATATVSGGVVTIRGVAAGVTDVTITAADGTGTATRTISVTVIGVGIATYDAMTAGNQISTITIANENSGTAMLYVELMRAPAANVVMSVTSSDANEGMVSPSTLTFSTTNWNTRQALTVTAVDDNVDRDGDSFMVDFAITTGDGGDYTSSLTLPSVAVTVTDDDVVSDTINLSLSQSTITETADATTITVTATLGGSGVASPTETIVTVSVGGGTATSGTDYTAVPNFDLTIPALSSSGIATFMIDPTDDGTGDNGETVTISGVAGGFTVNATTLTISEAGILVFDVASGGTSTNTITIANENSGTMTFYVRLISAPASDITLSVASSDTNEGTVLPATLTFSAATGATSWDSRQALTVTAVPDQIDRDDTFTVDFAITSGDTGNYPTSLTIPPVTVNITDDDTAAIALFDMATGSDAPSITTSEGATTDSFYVALTSEPTADVTVTIGLRAGEHTLPPLFGTTLTFTPTGATAWNIRQVITLTGVNDDVVDGDQTYDLTLSPAGGGYDSVMVETVSLTNTDDDTAVLTITNTAITVNEDVGMARVTVTLTPAVTAGTVEVEATTTDGMATIAGGDYTALTSEPLTFRAGSTSETLNIPINNDFIDEDNENFTVTLDNLMLPAAVTGDVSIADSTAQVTITDDDTASTMINLSVNPPTVAETAGATTITVAATLGSDVVLTTPTDVMVTVGSGTDSATEGSDYATIAGFTLTIPALSSSATQMFTIDPTDDGTGDNGETVMISGTATGFTVNAATLTIVEAGISVFDAMSAGNQISTITIAEASNDILYVQLTSEPAASSSVTISVTSSASGEGTVSPATLTFTDANWDDRQALTVTAVDDNIDRENDSFMVNFEIISGDGDNYTSSLDLSSVAVLVTDDDVASDTIALTVSLDRITETAGEISVTVTATLNGAASATDTAVEVIINDEGTATPNTDYTLARISGTITLPTSSLTTITIPAELTSGDGTFAITPVADDVSDNGETVTISGTSGSLRINAATLTIIEFSREDQQAVEQTVAAQASGVTQVVTEQIGIRLASHISAGSAQDRQSLSSIDWQNRLAKFTYEGLKRLDSGADIMSLDWLFKAASGNGQVLMPLGAEALTLWATGGHISTKGDGVADYEGDVRSFILGVDTALANDWLVGVAISYNDSEVGYTMEGTPEANKTEQTLYGIHPYLSRTISKGLTLWATGGYGFGDVDFSDTRFGNTTSDVTQWMAAGGLEQQIITNTPWQGALRIKGLWGNAEVDATGYSGGIRIPKIESDFWRAHMESEMGYNFSLPGGTVRPYAIIGGRWDHNDAIVSGDEWHVDVGGGVEVIHPAFALNISVRTQVTEGDTEEDSIFATGSLTYDLEQDGRGLQIALSRPLDNTLPAFDSHSFSPLTDTESGLSGAPLTSELAYGWTVHPFGLEGALQTYVQNSFESHDRHYAVGLELAVSALTLNFETGYHTNLDSETDGSGLESMFKTKIRW